MINTTSTSASSPRHASFNVSKFIFDNIVWLLLIVGVIVMGLIDRSFFTFSIIANIIMQTTVLGVLTAGESFTLLIGEIDLSVTGNLAFSAGLGTYLMSLGFPWYLTIIFIVLLGGLFGLINGLLITKLKATALIETLAMNFVLSGGLMALTLGKTIVGFPDPYTWIGQQAFFGISTLVIPFVLVFVLVYVVWNHTVFGRSLYAVGGNSTAATVSGIPVDRIKILAFVISGLLAGLSGYLLSSYIAAVTMTLGQSYQMYCLAAAVIGGVSLKGGRGKISGVLGGVLLITVIQVGLQVLGINAYYVTLAGGFMIFIAVIFDAIRSQKG